ncbi:MAG: DUF3379 family protein [Lysobacteraceae bacterium]|nr:MAG: DUF3379 family protein [Xanthomonadaceae bacterium]
MDCVEFRRQLGVAPEALDGRARAHLADCTSGCIEAAAEARAFEARLGRTLAVPVPPALAQRLEDLPAANPQTRRPRGRRTAWIAFAAAAALVLAFGLAQWRRNAVPLADLVVAHVTSPDERAAWSLREPVAAGEVEAAFADRGVRLAGTPPAGVAYVALCGIGSRPIVHMLMPEQGRPVSVLYLPRYAIAAPAAFRQEELNGRTVQVGDGTLVLLARGTQRFDAIEHAWRDAIEGPAQIAAGSH